MTAPPQTQPNSVDPFEELATELDNCQSIEIVHFEPLKNNTVRRNLDEDEAKRLVVALLGHAPLKARIQELEEALRFYANPYRYDGPNMPPLPDDPFQPEHLVYRMDVTRDFGSVARAALQPRESAE